jgi:hypothetical protein
LQQVEGMAAIVLGGSYARGTQHRGSDMDIGLYYDEAQPFEIKKIRQVAAAISTADSPTVTGFYGWGPWVNGGAWIQTKSGKVDFLYRDLDQVERIIAAAHQGIIQHDYDQQPTFGFYSVIYLAETKACLPLYDPEGRITYLKSQVQAYPPALKHKIINDWLWSGEFTLLHAHDYAASGDIYNTAGCLGRIASGLTQVLFALNETYFMTDKKVIKQIDSFPLIPEGYVEQLEAILARPGRSVAQLQRSVAALEVEWRQVAALAGESYQPQFFLTKQEDHEPE